MCIATENNGSSLPKGDITKGHSVTSSSALQRMAPLILQGYIFNSVCFFLVYAILPADLSPVPKYCPDDEPNCTRHGLFAFQVVSFFNLSFLGLLGFYTFFVSRRASNALPQTPQGRCLGNVLNRGRVLLPEADYVNAAIVIFQGWDFIASIFFEEHCTKIMMTHHLLAFFSGYFALAYEVIPYYSVFIGGVCEFSSIFLSISDLFQYYPPASLASSSSYLSSILPAIEAFSQASFVITFFLFRIFGWWYVSSMYFSDAWYVRKHGLLKRYSPGSGWYFWYLVGISFGLGGLQLFWGYAIINKILEMLNGN